MPSITDNSTLGNTSFFIQPSFGLSVTGFDVAFTPGFSRLNFHKVEYQTGYQNSSVKTNLDYLASHRTSILFEPSLTLRGGWDYLKVQTRWVLSNILSCSQHPFEHGNVSVGLQFAFAERFNNHKK